MTEEINEDLDFGGESDEELSSNEPLTLTVEEGGLRVDKYITDHLALMSRNQLKQRITSLTINGEEAKFSRKIAAGDVICLSYESPPETELAPQDIPLDILFENDNVVVVNKNSGLVVHPGSGHWNGTLANGLLYHCTNLKASFPSQEIRPGIVHRLDKDTSGVIITAKNMEAREFLANQFRDNLTVKQYLAVVKGAPPHQEGYVDINIRRDPNNRKKFTPSTGGGKSAFTGYKVLRSFPGFSFLLLSPKTGRTHQIRVHMKHVVCPILGDPIYSRNDFRHPDLPLMLHAYRLTITLPGEKEPRTFEAPVPERFHDFFAHYGYKVPEGTRF